MTNDEFDTIIDYARVLERYEDPRLRPLSKENFLIYDNARRALAHLRKTCTADSASAQETGVNHE